MKQAMDAIYENGHFRPVPHHPAHLVDGQRVRITVDDECLPESLRWLTSVYDGLSPDQIDEIERIPLDRGELFGERSRD